MIAKPVKLPVSESLAPSGTLFTTVVPLVLPSAGADGLTVDAAGASSPAPSARSISPLL